MATKITLENFDKIKENNIIAQTNSNSFSNDDILNNGFIYQIENELFKITNEKVILYENEKVFKFMKSHILASNFWILNRVEYNEYMSI